MEINNASKPEKFQFKEFTVLSSVICLMLLNGITVAVDIFIIDDNTLDSRMENSTMLHGYCQKLIPAIATLPTAILSELIGRKPSLAILAVASIVSSILHAFPSQQTCIIAGFVLQGVVRGGVFITTFLVISEICSPRHRFAYLIANMTAFNVGFELTFLRYWMEGTIGPVFVVPKQVIQVIQVALGVVCLGLVWGGPESPYWLARRGRVEESRRALLWLRGEGSEAELRSILQQPQPSGSPRLFWLPLLAGISAISVNIISSYLTFTTTSVFNIMLHFQLHDAVNLVFGIVFIPIVISLTYKVYHRSLFLVASVIILALSYAFAVWLYFVHGWFSSGQANGLQIFDFFVYSCNTILTGGPFVFGVVLCTRVIPANYNIYVVSVCFIYFHLMGTIQGLINVSPDSKIFGLAILETTLSYCCSFVFYFLLPDSKDKTLLDRREQTY